MIVQVLEIALFYMKKLNLFFFCAKIFLGGYFGMLNREKILEGIMNRKSYVSFTPYFTNSMGTRRQLNLITYPRYSKSEIFRMLDTDGAINFMEESTTAIEEFVKSLKETPLWSTFSCELSYFIDSRCVDEKNFRPAGPREGDILRGINCVTLGYSTIQDGRLLYDRRTFVVDLDEFVSSLETLGYLATFDSEGIGNRVVDRVLNEGLEASQELSFVKNYTLKTKSINPMI